MSKCLAPSRETKGKNREGQQGLTRLASPHSSGFPRLLGKMWSRKK